MYRVLLMVRHRKVFRVLLMEMHKKTPGAAHGEAQHGTVSGETVRGAARGGGQETVLH
jgi:hypothetical protein